MKTKFLFALPILLFAILTNSYAQDVEPRARSSSFDQIDVHEYRPNERQTVYKAMHKIIDANLPISYLSYIAAHNYQLSHLEPLTPEEGADGLLAEANIYLPFVLFTGRDYAPNWLQRSRLSFDYNGQIRIVDAESSPIVPPTNSFGLSLDYVLWDNFSTKKAYNRCFRSYRAQHKVGDLSDMDHKDSLKYMKGCNFDPRNFWEHCIRDTAVSFKMLHLNTRLFHYSNGQDTGFYFTPDNPMRHDYRSGNFSTNNIRVLLYFHNLTRKNRLISASMGYQREIGSNDGFLSFEAGQNDNYGRERILASLQFRTTARWWESNPPYSIDCSRCKDYRLKELFEYRFLVQAEHILDDTPNWRRGNFSDPYRTNVTATLEISPVRLRTLGFFFQFYYGRDYHNIRFDNVVTNFKIGITLSDRKFVPFMKDPSSVAVYGEN